MSAFPTRISSSTGEIRLINQALAGDIHAADKILQYLGSNNPNLRKIMLDSIRTFNQAELYMNCLQCLALGEWEVQAPNGQLLHCSRQSEAKHAERIEASIIELFSQASEPEQVQMIEAVLSQALEAPITALRHTAAYLLASRGDLSVIPHLEDAIERASLPWKIRAVRVLADLNDPRCGLPLVKALAMESPILHQEARRGLCELGEKAETAWITALKHPESHIRWHAARGLGEIGDARAIEILAAGLMDENQAVRWSTARVLARLDAKAVPAILNVLSCNPLTESFRQAAYHALHAMNSRQTQTWVAPLLEALVSPGSNISAPILAHHMLSDWQRSSAKKKSGLPV